MQWHESERSAASLVAGRRDRRTPSGRLIARGPTVSNWDDILKAASAGHAVVATAVEAARFYPWPNLAFVPVRDVAPCQWAFAWRTANREPRTASR